MEKTTTARFCLAIGGKTDSLSFSVSLVQPILLCTFVLHHCQLLRLGHRQLTGDLGKANPKGGVKKANSCLAGRFCYPMAGGRIGGKKKKGNFASYFQRKQIQKRKYSESNGLYVWKSVSNYSMPSIHFQRYREASLALGCRGTMFY